MNRCLSGVKGPRVPGTPQQHQACGDSISEQPPGGRLKLARGPQETRPGQWAGPWQEAVTGRCVSQTVPGLGQDGCQAQHGLLWQGPGVPEAGSPWGAGRCLGVGGAAGARPQARATPPGARDRGKASLSLCPSVPRPRSDRGPQPVFSCKEMSWASLFLELTGPGLNREHGPSPELSIQDSWAVSSLLLGV